MGGVELTEESSVCAFFARVAKEGPIWASIHLAGGFAAAPILETTAAQFVDQFESNTLSSFLCCREAIRHMRAAGAGGRIVNVIARPATEPRLGDGMSAYTASKGALAALTQALAEEVAPERIWVNAIAPSIIDTAANRAAQPEADYGRWPKPEELAATIAFLASPVNRCTRGSLVSVTGMC
jgi:NAD(P)-dependent dehydrogenase (short-subunit alcohol dehydrogenase family)